MMKIASMWRALFGSSERYPARLGPLLPDPLRPAPRMPSVKPPMPEHQVIRVKAGDTIVITSDRPMCIEQRGKLAEYVKTSMPADVKVMILDAGMKIAAVAEGRNLPNIPMPSPGR
ncbi:MAG: hypothetical protein ACXW2U_05395 [Telluria sp.]